ncbi:MAG: hypothetical protein RIE53_02210 [Rhodothermales bacterium]
MPLHNRIPAVALAIVFLPAVLLSLVLLAGCSGDAPDANDIAFATAEPVPHISTPEGEAWLSMNGEGTRMVFGRHAEGWSGHTLWETIQDSTGTWSAPAVMPFSGTYNDRAPRFYPALDAFLFSSDRPHPADAGAEVAPSTADGAAEANEGMRDFNIWIAMHDGEDWMAPEPLDAVNSDANDFHASVTEGGVIYFASDREGGAGRSDIYRAELGSGGYVVARLEGPVNTAFSEADVFADPAERFLIFSRTAADDSFGGDDLYVSWRTAGGWSEPVNLGPLVNTAEYEYGAWIPYPFTSDAYLHFTTHKDGQADVVRIPVSAIDALNE